MWQVVVLLSEPKAVVSIQTILEGFNIEWRVILQDVVVMMGRDEECKSLYRIQTSDVQAQAQSPEKPKLSLSP